MLRQKSDNPRLLLARLRKADFAHAGDDEAIDIVLEKINQLYKQKSSTKLLAKNMSNNKDKKALDVGCGLGGTADYIRKKTSFDIFGVDVDVAAINHAKQYYPEVNLFECDAGNIDKFFDKQYFDFIYLFNVFYAFNNQRDILEKLSNVAKPGAILAIFDYTKSSPHNIELKDLAGKKMNLIYIEDVKKWLKEVGWELIEVVDLSVKYEKWYRDFINNLKSQKSDLLLDFTEEAYDKVLSTFSFLSGHIKNKEMGGCVIYARLHEMDKDQTKSCYKKLSKL